MRILYVVRNMNVGGLENFVRSLFLNRDRSMDFECLICDLEESDYEQDLREDGIVIHKVAAPFGTKYAFKKELDNFFRNNDRYDLVYSHMAFSNGIVGMAAKKHGIHAVMLHSHGMSLTSHISFAEAIYRAMMRRLMRNYGDMFVACSQAAGNFLFGERIFGQAGAVVKNGIAVQRFAFDLEMRHFVRRSLKIKEGGMVLGHCGSLCRNKNQSLILRIASQLADLGEDVSVLLLGYGSAKQELESLAKELGIAESVHFLGKTGNVQPYLCAMDVFVFPSYSEGFGISLLEAQASGLPCVVSEAIQEEAKVCKDKIITVSLSAPVADWAKAVTEGWSFGRYNGRARLEEAGLGIEESISAINQMFRKVGGG